MPCGLGVAVSTPRHPDDHDQNDAMALMPLIGPMTHIAEAVHGCLGIGVLAPSRPWSVGSFVSG
eukprot:7477112-Alexandrium_andersonii.AAC.1